MSFEDPYGAARNGPDWSDSRIDSCGGRRAARGPTATRERVLANATLLIGYGRQGAKACATYAVVDVRLDLTAPDLP